MSKLACKFAGFKKGDKIKTQFGGFPEDCRWATPHYLRGVFSHYSKTGKYGYFIHTKSGKLLKRKSEDFLIDY